MASPPQTQDQNLPGVSGNKSVFRLLVIALIGILLVALFFALTRPDKVNPKAPRYLPVTSQPTGPISYMDYDWLADDPFPNRTLWLWVTGPRGANYHAFLYDLQRNIAVGELLNASPVFSSQDQQKILCEAWNLPSASLKTRLIALFNRIAPPNHRLTTNYIQTFYILNVTNNSSRRVGDFSQYPGTGSRWHTSPNFHYGYNVPSTARQGAELFLCDFEAMALSKLSVTGVPYGWWDDQNILIKDLANNFVIFNVVTRNKTTLFSATTVGEFLQKSSLPGGVLRFKPFSVWNGHDYDFYFTGRTNWVRDKSFLVKAERAGPALRLLSRDFQFEWSSHFDASATHYLYDGEPGTPGAGGNGGVNLRNLADNTTRTIIPPDNKGQYAISRFEGDVIIYYTNSMLWRIDLNGSNNLPLLPSPAH